MKVISETRRAHIIRYLRFYEIICHFSILYMSSSLWFWVVIVNLDINSKITLHKRRQEQTNIMNLYNIQVKMEYFLHLFHSNGVVMKESLFSDSQTSTWTKKRQRHMSLYINVLAWDRHKNVVGLNWLIGFQPSPFDNLVSNGKL